MSIILYARVSTRGQAERDLSLPAQLKLLNRYAAHDELEVEAAFEDVASGRSFHGRPGLMDAVALACSSSRANELVVQRIDRIARNTLDYLTLVNTETTDRPLMTEANKALQESTTPQPRGSHQLRVPPASHRALRPTRGGRTRFDQ